MQKKATAIIGVILGVVMIIVGISLQGTEVGSIGKYISFGGDFYTEMYSVTRELSSELSKVINNVTEAIGWLIICIGLFDIAYFSYRLAQCQEEQDMERPDTAVPGMPPVYPTAPQNMGYTQPMYPPVTQAPPPPAPSKLAPGQWACTCGRIHQGYESSCVCGVTKAEAKAAQKQ